MGGFLRNPRLAMQIGRYGAEAMGNARAGEDRKSYNSALAAMDTGGSRPDNVEPAIWDKAVNDREASRGAKLSNDSKATAGRRDAFAESFIHSFHSKDPAPLMKTLSDHNSKFTFRTRQTGDGQYQIERAEDGTENWQVMPLMGKETVGLKDVFTYFDNKVYGKEGGVVEHIKEMEKSGKMNKDTLYKTADGRWRAETHGGQEYQGAIDPGQVPMGTAMANNPNKYGVANLGDRMQPYGQNQMTGEVTPMGHAMTVGKRPGAGGANGAMGMDDHMKALDGVAQKVSKVTTDDGKEVIDQSKYSFIGQLGRALMMRSLVGDGYQAGWQAGQVAEGIDRKVEQDIAQVLASPNQANVFLNAHVKDEYGYREVLKKHYRDQAMQGGYQEFLGGQGGGFKLDGVGLSVAMGGGAAQAQEPESEYYPPALEVGQEPGAIDAMLPSHSDPGITARLRAMEASPAYRQSPLQIPGIQTGQGGFQRGQGHNQASIAGSFLKTPPTATQYGEGSRPARPQ